MDIARPDLKKKKRQRQIVIWTVVGVVVVLVLLGLSRLERAAYEVDRSSVWIEAVQRGPFVRSVRGPGTLVPESIRWISAQTEGRVERRVIDPGARVEPDTVILELSNDELERSVQDAELALRAAEAQFIDLRVRLESQVLDQEANLARVRADHKGAVLQVEADRELFTNGLIPEIQLRRSELASEQLTVRFHKEEERLLKTAESIEAQLAVQRTEVAQQRALYDLRRSQLDALKVRAGITGVLQQVPVEEGQRVAPGANLARVAQPEKLKAELRIAETQAKDIQIGQLAIIDTRNGKVEGRVARIDPAVQQGTVTVDIRLPDELPKGARPDLSVDGTIELERLDDVLYVGRPAYGQANHPIGLYKIQEDGETALRVQVALGRSSVQHMEIVSGLEVGDQVILSDSSQWDEHERIRLR